MQTGEIIALRPFNSSMEGNLTSLSFLSEANASFSLHSNVESLQIENVVRAVSRTLQSLSCFILPSETSSRLTKETDCMTTLAAGALGSVAMGNLLPLALTSLNCFHGVEGRTAPQREIPRREIPRVTVTRPGEIPSYSVDNRPEQLRMELFGELQSQIPENLKGEFRAKQGWVDYIIAQMDVFLNTISVTTPINVFKSEMENMNEYYWMSIVKPKYYEIFPDIPVICYSITECNAGELVGIRTTLNRYGYNALVHGTPLQFIAHLKKQGVCEKSICGKR